MESQPSPKPDEQKLPTEETDTTTPPSAETPEQPAVSPMPLKLVHTKKSKLPLILIVIVLLAAGAAAIWWFVLRDGSNSSATSTSTNDTTTTDTTTQQPAAGTPKYLVYAAGVGTNSPSKMIQRSLSDNSEVTALTIDGDGYITDTLQQGKNVYAHVIKDGVEQAWVSTDEGKTYKKLYEGTATTQDMSGDQITSAVFSKDNSSLLLAVLNGEKNKNTVTSFTLASAEKKDIFSLDKSGVFLYGYDSASGTVYYNTGCYNCDGYREGLISRYTSAKGRETVYEMKESERALASVRMNSDLTKLLIVVGTASTEGPGLMEPYDIKEVGVSDGSVTNHATITDTASGVADVGFMSDGRGFYVSGNTVKLTGSNTPLLETTKPILEVYFASKDHIFAKTGEYNDFSVVQLDIAASKLADILTNQNITSTQVTGVIVY